MEENECRKQEERRLLNGDHKSGLYAISRYLRGKMEVSRTDRSCRQAADKPEVPRRMT